jgi:galactokinase/mevalonate kinase-like predicted kinase
MGPTTILMYGLGGTALVGIITMLLTKFSGRSKEKKLLDVFKKDKQQEILTTKIKEVSKEQEIIDKQLKASETSSKETKEKIKKTLQKAAVEIQNTLKQDKISEIDAQIDSDWEDL